MRTSLLLVASMCVALAGDATAGPADDLPIVRAMKDEIARAMGSLQMPGLAKPYFISYSAWQLARYQTTATFGASVATYDTNQNSFDVDLRVGDYTFDNSNASDESYGRTGWLTEENDYDAYRRGLWLTTDRAYKSAVEALDRKKAVREQETKSPDEVGSFSKEPASNIIDMSEPAAIDRPMLDRLARTLSASFRNHKEIYDGSVAITAFSGRHFFASSEGSLSVQPGVMVRIVMTCSTQASDGMPLSSSSTIWVRSPKDLPGEAELVARASSLAKEVIALRAAPVVDGYAGPLLVTDVAAAQLLRVLLADHLVGTPPPKTDRPGGRSLFGESELVGKVGQRILPPGVMVIDDPKATHVDKKPLIGTGLFDEEGIPMQKVTLVENGRFKTFLMSRTPRKGFEHSNGHAFSSSMIGTRAHPANLILSSSKPVADKELRKRALKAAKDAGNDYVLVVEKFSMDLDRDDVDPSVFMGGGSPMPKPAIIKRVYANGKEQLVRGAVLASLPLRALRDLIAIGTTRYVYSYLSSGVPARFALFSNSTSGSLASIAAPALLFRDVDVKKPLGAQKRPPIVPRP